MRPSPRLSLAPRDGQDSEPTKSSIPPFACSRTENALLFAGIWANGGSFMKQEFLKKNDYHHSREAATNGCHDHLQPGPLAGISQGNCADDGSANETNQPESISRHRVLRGPFRADLLKKPQRNRAKQDQINN